MTERAKKAKEPTHSSSPSVTSCSTAAQPVIATASAVHSSSGSSSSTNADALLSSAFLNIRTISAFSLQHQIFSEYTDLTRKLSAQRARRSYRAGVGYGGSTFSMFVTYALLFWYGSSLVKKGEISFEDMMTAIFTMLLGALGVGQALMDMGDQRIGLQAARRIFENIDQGMCSPIDGLSTEGKVPAEHLSGGIEFNNVTFAYPTRPDIKVCENYSLTIAPNQMVALVGPSGSGKSTIANLLLRFYEPQSGNILLDGCDIRTLNVRYLRSQIGYVGQEPELFSGSVLQNVARGRVDLMTSTLPPISEAMAAHEAHCRPRFFPTEFACWPRCVGEQGTADAVDEHSLGIMSKQQKMNEDEHNTGDIELGNSNATCEYKDVITACKLSNAHEFISALPEGYNTDLGSGGMLVSGGQKQRIAIARALVKGPSVLLLDEATSALDSASERLVQEAIDALQQHKQQTTIVIAHRLSTIRNADKIIVVDQGQIVETGTHDTLLQQNGLYARLWAKQNCN